MNKQLATLKQDFTRPLLADLMEHRLIGWALAGAAGVQTGLIASGLPGWWCPFRHVLGFPCPGCGLSRAIEALLRGDWETALTFHAFAPLLVLVLALLVVASFLPARLRQRLITRLTCLERRFGLGALGLSAMFIYWLVRLLFFSESYWPLVMN